MRHHSGQVKRWRQWCDDHLAGLHALDELSNWTTSTNLYRRLSQMEKHRTIKAVRVCCMGGGVSVSRYESVNVCEEGCVAEVAFVKCPHTLCSPLGSGSIFIGGLIFL